MSCPRNPGQKSFPRHQQSIYVYGLILSCCPNSQDKQNQIRHWQCNYFMYMIKCYSCPRNQANKVSSGISNLLCLWIDALLLPKQPMQAKLDKASAIYLFYVYELMLFIVFLPKEPRKKSQLRHQHSIYLGLELIFL